MARKRSTDLATSPLVHRTLTPPGLFLIRMLDLPDAGRLPRRHPAQAALRLVPEQSGPQRPDRRRAGVWASFTPSGRCMRLYPEIRWVNAFRIADPGLAISHAAGVARADGGAAARPHRRRCRCRPPRCARSWIRSARVSTRRATPAATSSACWCSSACSAPSGVCCRRSRRSAAPSMSIDTGGSRQRHGVLRFEGRPRRALEGHGHGVLLLAAGSRPARWCWASSSCRRATPTTASTTSSRNGCPAITELTPGGGNVSSDQVQPPALDRHPAHAARGFDAILNRAGSRGGRPRAVRSAGASISRSQSAPSRRSCARDLRAGGVRSARRADARRAEGRARVGR